MGRRLIVLILCLFLIPVVSATSNTTLGFAGSVVDVASGNYTQGEINITLNVTTTADCNANVIYSELFVDNVSDGVFSLLAGYYDEPLNLNYNADYFSCYEITNGTFTEVFGADPFTSGKGIIGFEDVNDSEFFHGNLELFFHNESSTDVTNHFLLSSLSNDTPERTMTTTIDGNQGEIKNWTTASDVPSLSLLPDGVYHAHFHARKTLAGTKDARLYINLYRRDTSGIEYLLGTSEESDLLTTSFANYNVHFFLGDVSLNTTDRLTVQVNATISGGGADPVVEIQYEGTTSSRLEIPSVAVSIENFVPYTSAIRNVDLGSYNLTSGNILIDGAGRKILYDTKPQNYLELTTGVTLNSTGNVNLRYGLNDGIQILEDSTGDRVIQLAQNGILMQGDLYYELDVDKMIEFGGAHDRFDFHPSRTGGSNYWQMSSTGNGVNNPILYPSSNMEAQICSNGRRCLEAWIARQMLDVDHWGRNITNLTRVGIGLTDPLQTLHVNSSVILFDNTEAGSIDVRIQNLAGGDGLLTFREGATKQWEIRRDNFLSPLVEPLAFNSNGANNVLILQQDGRVSINTTSDKGTLIVGGIINATDIIYTNSTERVCTAENGLCEETIPVDRGQHSFHAVTTANSLQFLGGQNSNFIPSQNINLTRLWGIANFNPFESFQADVWKLNGTTGTEELVYTFTTIDLGIGGYLPGEDTVPAVDSTIDAAADGYWINITQVTGAPTQLTIVLEYDYL